MVSPLVLTQTLQGKCHLSAFQKKKKKKVNGLNRNFQQAQLCLNELLKVCSAFVTLMKTLFGNDGLYS